MTGLLEQQRFLQREVVRLLTAETGDRASVDLIRSPAVTEVAAADVDVGGDDHLTEACSSLKSNSPVHYDQGYVDDRWLRGFERRLTGQIRRTVRQEIRKVVPARYKGKSYK